MSDIWNPPIYSAGSLQVLNLYNTIRHGEQWAFELCIRWQDEDIAINQEALERHRQNGDSHEHLKIAPEGSGYNISYTAHLVSDGDVKDIKWSATLEPYTGNGMPYLGMWQIVSQAENYFHSSAQERSYRKLRTEQRREAIFGFFIGSILLLSLAAICYFMFFR